TSQQQPALESSSGRRPRPEITVVVPVYNEEECLPELHRRLSASLAPLGADYELLFINDGSRDRSLPILRDLAARDPHVAFASFSRNFGHEAATSCGLARARGAAVVLIDADLQDPPELIPELVAKWRAGADVVYAQRRRRAGESQVTKLTSYLFYRIFRKLAKVEMPVDVGDFRLMDRRVVKAFRRLPERRRFVRGLVAWAGFKQESVFYDRDSRFGGETKYHFWNRLSLAFDAICGMSVAPLQWIGATGGIMIGTAMAASIVLPLAGASLGGAGWLAVALLFIGGLQLAGLGLASQYLGRIYVESQRRPLYIVAEHRHSRSGEGRAARTERGRPRAAA
ncbi:MAG TPA: glycosyltransferase family 2 protein, partial [Planctomycetia bacterium]|nr:glycosyltransferase family 2 protein [Planctomycetia bacterium]